MWRVAILEDNAPEAASLVRYLEAWEAQTPQVHLAISTFGDTATFLAEKRPFDLVFFDIEMPGMNGMQAARVLRDRSITCPLIFVTSLAQYAVAGYEVGASGYLVKPVDWGAFCLRMEAVMRKLEA